MKKGDFESCKVKIAFEAFLFYSTGKEVVISKGRERHRGLWEEK